MGVSCDTLRYYERLGILQEPPRTACGYRMYSAAAVDRVRLVRQALQLGFTLRELADVLHVRDGGGVPCQHVLHLTEEKLRSLGEHISELRRTQSYMRQLVRQWRVRLEHTLPGQKAILLQSLADRPIQLKRKSGSLKRRNQL